MFLPYILEMVVFCHALFFCSDEITVRRSGKNVRELAILLLDTVLLERFCWRKRVEGFARANNRSNR